MLKITFSLANQVLAQAIAEFSSQAGLPVSIAIACPTGTPIIAVRMDNAHHRTMDFALRKAYSAAYRESSTLDLKDFLAKEGLELAAFANPKLSSLPGGVPIKVKEQCLGSVGISGRLPLEDHALACQLSEQIIQTLGINWAQV